ncbi:MAG: ATP-binding protein [Muribaculaceae bacterium]|nr:ATP-binding protein [Roseburia sp.]MCM1431097.1 ATP-binding protein [Muribaculaceae bacterium]MCM1492520.1 ATP-binding protein [Muribaculaceae bacterium]
MEREKRTNYIKKYMLIAPFIVVFCVLGAVVFAASRRISVEMSESAISNLSENLELISNTMETLLNQQVNFQKMLAQELASEDDPAAMIRSYSGNSAMVKLSLVLSGEEEGISNTGETFTADALDFSAGKAVASLPLSESYVNSMGTWAYTIKCPVIKDGKEIATLYAEYIYAAFDEALPDRFYNDEARLYLVDTASERLVLTPKGVGERDAGHMTLDDFYNANKIDDPATQSSVATHMRNGKDMMFYHDILNEESLVYMWSVNDGAVYLIGYVPIGAIQREGNAVNQNIFIVVFVTLAAFFSCCLLYFFFERQHNKIRKEQEAEREYHNRQLKEALQAAQIASSSKTMFLSNMSHDIRTPMNAILGFATLLEKDADDPERVRDYIGKIKASGQHLLSLINDVLDISKIESGKVVLTVGEFTLQGMIDSVDAIIRPAAKARNQNFTIEVSGIAHERLLGDETRLNQILINLLSNAVKYTQEGGEIRLRITGLAQHTSQYEHIRIEVEDNGYGMTPEFLETIFDAFTRAENSTTNKVQGTGLGMAITKNIVELMGGTIEVASEMGAGSRFVVELELRIPETEETKSRDDPASDDTEESRLKGKHFLVVEDNDINSEILCEILRMEDVTCDVAENGRQAVDSFQQAPPGTYDAILMDVQMPVMNGYEATREIRALAREDAESVPIIAMTANAFAEDVKDALDAGMNAHIAKPIDIALLNKTISQYLK